MIEKVTQRNYNQSYAGIKNSGTRKYSPNFTGNVVKPLNVANYLKQKSLIKFMEKLKWFDGEKGRILITAIGTGAIAPLFIAWNPYVKPKENATQEEKDNLKRTQKYTAMRQPISAALAIPIQMSLVTPIEKGLDILFNNPKFSKFIPTYLDKNALQDDKYIERQEAKKLKGEKLTKAERKAKLNANVESVKNAQISNVAQDFLQTGQIRIREGAEGIVDNKSTVEALKAQIKSYIGDANFLRYDSLSDDDLNKLLSNPASELTGSSKGKDFYTKRAETLINNETELNKILNTNLPKDKTQITQYLKTHIANVQDEELKKVYQEIIDLADGDSQVSRCSRTIERIDKIKKICNGEFTPKKYMEHLQADESELLKRIRRFAEIHQSIEENPESIKKVINELAENCHFDQNDKRLNKIFHEISTFCENTDKLKQKISKDIVKEYKSIMGKRYRFIKEVAGISLGLFVTVPITCHVLNWVYPRFMEIFFPKLTGKQKEFEKAKLAALNNGGEK